MKHRKNNILDESLTCGKGFLMNRFINMYGFVKQIYMFLLIGVLVGCDDFVDVELPKDQLVKETVFSDVSTAAAALRHVYAGLRVSNLSIILGLYADELDKNLTQDSFYEHSIISSNTTVSSLWKSFYSSIFAVNSIIEGVENSSELSLEDKNQLRGEALFVRAYLHTLLVELWGPIPYVHTTGHLVNNKVSRMSVNVVYSHIINDLLEASSLLGEDISVFEGEQRIRIYEAVSQALLARLYLYTEEWGLAEAAASSVISRFVLEQDVSKVFLKNSSGTIWQFKPALEGENTEIAELLIFTIGPGFQPTLSESVVDAFESEDDLRKRNWIGNVNSDYFAFKYKEPKDTPLESLEYLIAFRLAEQYLIRAEARAKLDNIAGAQSDLNIIRSRAGLPNTNAIAKEDLIEAIINERQVELFTEYGHRWFDLKRTGKAAHVLAPLKPSWSDTDVLWPVPQSEILLNPNLLPQNNGYD